jgi:uncharacterized membrane protein (UPF0127 family)
MDSRGRVVLASTLVVVLLIGVLVLVPQLWLGDPGTYDNTPVTVVDDNGTELATVDARVADTQEKRRIGLRRVENLSDGEGMLFVHERDGEKPYIMPPEMSVALDIVFVAPDGTIRTIEHASIPEDDTTLRYPGRGQYVLEVPRGYTNRTGIEPGDRILIPENVSAS